MIAWFYSLAVVSLLVGTAAIYMALIEAFPVRWLRWHYFIRKPVVWTIFVGTLSWGSMHPQSFPALVAPLALMALGIVLTHRMHQEVAFQAIDFPPQAEAESLPLGDEMEIAIIEHGGVTRAYALDHLIHHHIINDHFGDRIVAVTYCAMCRSVIPFDVTEIGPLFVGSFKNANMIVADRRTKTFFQQATFRSLVGPLHPMDLTMVGYQLLTWKELKEAGDVPPFCRFTATDLRAFQLPIPGLWRHIVSGEATPGLSAARRNRELPARTHVIGLIDAGLPPVAVRRDDVRAKGMVTLPDLNVLLVSGGGGVNAFRVATAEGSRDLELTADHRIRDRVTGTSWTLRGKAVSGTSSEDLTPVALSDEYWFSWKFFHPGARVVRV